MLEKQHVEKLPRWRGKAATCPLILKEAIDQLISQDPSLLQRWEGKDQLETIENLARYCRAFKDNKNLEAQGDLNLLCRIISEQQGSCRHRAWAFQALAMYFGFHTHLIYNERHAWIEVSVDSGRSWETIDLGGTLHVDIINEIKKAEFSPTQRGVKANAQALAGLKGKSNEELTPLAKAMGISVEELEAAIQAPEGTPLTLGEQVDCNEMIKELLKNSQDDEGFLAGLAMHLEEPTFDLDRHTIIMHYFLSRHLKHNGVLNPGTLCQLLLEAHNKQNPDKAEAWQLNMECLAKILVKNHNSSTDRIDGRMFEEILSFLCLDQDWLGHTSKAYINALKVLVQSEKFGESAYKQLQTVYQSLNQPLDVEPLVKKQKSEPLSQVFAKGKSKTLESQLSGKEIKTRYSWETEGVLIPSRWVKRLPPFSRSYVERSLQPPVILMSPKKIKIPYWILYCFINKDTGEITKLDRQTLLLSLIRKKLKMTPFNYHEEKIAIYAEILFERLNRKFYLFSELETDMKKEGCTEEQIKVFADAVYWPNKWDRLYKTFEMPEGCCSLEEVLVSEFLEYLCKKTHASEGKLKIYDAATSYDTPRLGPAKNH